MSIRIKVFLVLLVLTLLPYGLASFFIFKYGENQLRNNIKNQQLQNIALIQQNIQNYFLSMKKNLNFWSKAQILDDILIGDLDKRIQIFLDQIKTNYHLKGILLVVNKEGRIIASTKRKLVGKSFWNIGLSGQNNFILTFPVFSSFDKRKIGEFVYIFKPYYLKSFLYKNPFSGLSLYNTKSKARIGYIEDIPEILLYKNEYEDKEYIYFSQGFSLTDLKNWLLISQINKEAVFSPLRKIQDYFFFVFITGFFLIVAFSFYISEKLVRPIKNIAETMEYVVDKKDYSVRVLYSGKDEIGILAKAFNHMLSEVETALKTIEKENKRRLYLFKNLIEIFSRITSVQKDTEVLDVAVKELQKFFKDIKIHFSKKKMHYSVPIKTKSIEGYLVFETKKTLTKEEKNFYTSIGELINLLLEKVELLTKAQEASKAKSAFISNMSHELRTPLNSILGFSQFLQSIETDSTKREALKSIETAGRHLLEMINDILDYAKLEAGAVYVKKERFFIKELLDEVFTIVKPLAEDKNLKLEYFYENFPVYSDKKLLKQILLNLLSNGIKFTEKGYIRVKAWKENDKVFFSAKDTGIGIKNEDIEKIFQDFTQLENPLQKRYKGTGLGLAIVKKYIELLGGKIEVHSQEYKGTEFVFWIKEN